MNIIIVGCGKVGRTLTKHLNDEKHNIAVIDTDSHAVSDLANAYDVLGVVGNGASNSVLVEAGVEEADLFIAVTESDELNLLCCMIAKKTANCKAIARVRNPIYNKEVNFIKEELGLSMIINPELAAAAEIARILRFPSAINIETFSKGRLEILEFQVNACSVLNDISIMDMSRRLKADVLVCGIQRKDEIIIPNGRTIIKDGDIISLIGAPKQTKLFFKEIGFNTDQVKDTMIVGGGTLAYYLATSLIKMGIGVKIIERDEHRCEELSELLPEAVIINADATNQEVLIEEGIDNISSFVTLTGIDEGNIFLSLYARSRTNAKLITKINRIAFDDIVDTFNLGSIIAPKDLTAQYILRYARALQNGMGSNVETLYRIINKKAEALEFKITSEALILGKALENINLKPNTLIASIIRRGEIITPNGKTIVEEGDSVIVVSTQLGLSDINDILGA